MDFIRLCPDPGPEPNTSQMTRGGIQTWIFHVRPGSHSTMPGLAGWRCGCVHHVSMGLLGFGTHFLVHSVGSHRVYPGIMTMAHEIIRFLGLGETSEGSPLYLLIGQIQRGPQGGNGSPHTHIFRPFSGRMEIHSPQPIGLPGPLCEAGWSGKD